MVGWFSNITKTSQTMEIGEPCEASPSAKVQDWPKPLGPMGQTSLIPASAPSLYAVPTSGFSSVK